MASRLHRKDTKNALGPDGTAAAIVLLEHRWEIPLRQAVEHAGGALLAAEWLHAADLVAIGFAAAEEPL